MNSVYSLTGSLKYVQNALSAIEEGLKYQDFKTLTKALLSEKLHLEYSSDSVSFDSETEGKYEITSTIPIYDWETDFSRLLKDVKTYCSIIMNKVRPTPEDKYFDIYFQFTELPKVRMLRISVTLVVY